MRKRLEGAVNQSRVLTVKKSLKNVRDQFRTILWSEMDRVQAEIENRKKGICDNTFLPLFDFSKQVKPIFGAVPDQGKRAFDIRSYQCNIVTINFTEFHFSSMIADQDDFIDMFNSLVEIMNSSQIKDKQVLNDFQASVTEFNQPLTGRVVETQFIAPSEQPRAKKEKTWMTRPSHIVEDFDLTELHRLVADELERVKSLYFKYSKHDRRKPQVWKDKILEAHKLGVILQVYPEPGDKESIDNFLLAVQYFLKHFQYASESILIHSLKPGVTKYNGLSGKDREMRCLSDFKELADNDGRIARMLGKEREMPTPRMFQPRPPLRQPAPPAQAASPTDDDHPLLARKSTGIFRGQ